MSAPAPRRMPWQLSIVLIMLSAECLVLIAVTREPLGQLPAGEIVHLAISFCCVGFAGIILGVVLQTWQLSLRHEHWVHPATRWFTWVYAVILLLPATLWLQPMDHLERIGLLGFVISGVCLLSLAADAPFWRRRA